MTFGDKLNAMMKEFDISVSDITDLIGVGIPTVYRWLDGKTTPHPRVIDYIFKDLEELIKAKNK